MMLLIVAVNNSKSSWIFASLYITANRECSTHCIIILVALFNKAAPQSSKAGHFKALYSWKWREEILSEVNWCSEVRLKQGLASAYTLCRLDTQLMVPIIWWWYGPCAMYSGTHALCWSFPFLCALMVTYQHVVSSSVGLWKKFVMHDCSSIQCANTSIGYLYILAHTSIFQMVVWARI